MFMLLSEMPSYLKTEVGFSASLAGILCIFPYLALYLGTQLFAKVFTDLQSQRGWSVRSVRQAAMRVAFIGTPTCQIIGSFMPNKWATLVWLIASQVTL